MSRQPDLLKDSPGRLMRKLSLPGILGMMVLSVNSLVDSMYLGNLVSAAAFAAVSLLFPLTLVVTGVTGFIAAGSSSVLSRAIGSGDRSVQRLVFPNLLAFSLIGSGLLMLLGLPFSKEALTLLGAEELVHQMGVAYLEVYLLGVFFSVYGLSANGLIRSEGKIRQAMTYTVMAVILNIALTPVFIVSLGMGVKGAAWSSIVSMIVYSVLTSLYFIRGKASFAVGAFGIRIEKAIINDVLGVGFSVLSMQLSNVLRQFIVFRSITWYGSAHDLAVFSAAFRLFSFVSLPAMGLLQPLQPIVGINYGAANLQRCIHSVKSFRLGAILSLVLLTMPILLFPEWFIGLMIPGETVSGSELHYLRLIFLALPFLPVSSSTIIFFQAIGKAKKATFLPFARQALLFLPLILLLPYFTAVKGIYYTLALENVLYALILWFVLKVELQKLRQRLPVQVG